MHACSDRHGLGNPGDESQLERVTVGRLELMGPLRVLIHNIQVRRH